MKPTLLLCLLIVMFSPAVRAQNGGSGGISHGTINIVLANANGIVVLTDSMVTLNDGRQMPGLPYQKFYKLDDKSVCAIAGFLAGPGPADVYVDASTLIRQYTDQMKNLPPQTIQEKLKTLTFLFRSDVSSLATLRAAADQQTDLKKYTSQITVAGFDTDGVARIGQVTLSAIPQSFGFLDLTPSDEPVKEVGKRLVCKLAGMPEVADGLLAHPSTVNDDAALADYAASMSKDQGESLTIGQMKALAARLAAYTANEEPGVGGQNQIAVLEHAGLTSLELPNFPPPAHNLSLPQVIAVYTYGVIETPQGSPPSSSAAFYGKIPILYMWMTFKNMDQTLDGNYFFHSAFVACILRYDGERPFHLDKNNLVDESNILVLGPRVDRRDPQVQWLLHNFKWKNVYRYCPPPLSCAQN
jgi:hypothetical protein